MKALKKTITGILLMMLVVPVYANPHKNSVIILPPGTTYAQPVYGGYCLQWVPQQARDNGSWIPGHYVNVCYNQNYPNVYYGYNPRFPNNPHHHHHRHN